MGHQYFAKKCLPLTAGTHPTGHRISRKKTFPPVSAWTHRKCLLITHKKTNTPPASWDPPWWEADLWAY